MKFHNLFIIFPITAVIDFNFFYWCIISIGVQVRYRYSRKRKKNKSANSYIKRSAWYTTHNAIVVLRFSAKEPTKNAKPFIAKYLCITMFLFFLFLFFFLVASKVKYVNVRSENIWITPDPNKKPIRSWVLGQKRKSHLFK